MKIARKKKKENIVEYLLYMWQIEDLIRAYELNMDKIREQLLAHYKIDEQERAELEQWYSELLDMMLGEGKRERGHLAILHIVQMDLEALHHELMQSEIEVVYQGLYYKILPAVVQLRAKSGGEAEAEIATCLTAVYGYLMLRMSGKPISPETVQSLKDISAFLAVLAEKYHQREEDTGIAGHEL